MTNALNHEPRMAAVCFAGGSIDGLRHLSSDEFRQFGLPLLAYLRQSTAQDGTQVFTIHAADGTQMVQVDELDTALDLAELNKILLVVRQ